jgi:hypothetical protein
MKRQIKSVFNLIEIFRSSAKAKMKSLTVTPQHCQNSSLHDYYCDQDHLGV